MKKYIVQKINPRQTREFLSNPFSAESLNDRLTRSGASSQNDNIVHKDLGNGYLELTVKNKNLPLRPASKP